MDQILWALDYAQTVHQERYNPCPLLTSHLELSPSTLITAHSRVDKLLDAPPPQMKFNAKCPSFSAKWFRKGDLRKEEKQ